MKEQIESALKELNLESEYDKVDLFIKYIDQLIYWNKAYNLTALRNKKDILVNHLFDCLAIIPHLRSLFPNEAKKVLDIGSGAGLPGIVIAICQPDWEVVCIDAVGKKTSFIKQVKGLLDIRNLESKHARVEQLPNLNADLIVSRAFASLVDFVNLSSTHMKKDGIYLAMKGKYPKDEVGQLSEVTNWYLDKVINLEVPDLDAERCLLVLKTVDGIS